MSSFQNLPFKIKSGAKVNISSGKASVNKVGILIDLEVQHISNGNGTAHYALGLDSDVTYADNYFFRFTRTTTDGSDDITLSHGNVFVPNAVASDGIIDLYFFTDTGAGDFSTAAFGTAFQGDVEVGNPDSVNNRYPLKLSAGNGATIEVELEWEL